MAADLTAYVPRLLLGWEASQPSVRYRAIDGTLVFADVSGFTKLSERLARSGGKIGAEQMTDVINGLFGELLLVAAARGGEMLKYGGDAVLLFFAGEDHASRGTAACVEMQRKLRDIGRVNTGAGVVRLRMSVGVNSGTFDYFKVGGSHEELVVAGPATTQCVAMEAAADAGEVLLSPSTVAMIGDRFVGAEKAGGRLLRRLPKAPLEEFKPVETDLDVSKFVPVALRSYLAGGAVEPDHRLATIAFLHVMDLDRRLRKFEPEAVARQLDETFETIQDVFTRHEISFLATDLAPDGTKVMAASGAPFAISDTAGAMLAALVALRELGTPLPIRVGVNHGHVFSGDVGPPFRRTYTTIGDVTNTAARVMGRAEAGEILCLGAVTDYARLRFDTEVRPAFFAKGKSEPLAPLAVIRERRVDTTDGQLPFVGRTEELGRLVTAFASVEATGQGLVAEVSGAPGIGKSRLLAEAASRTGLRPLTVAAAPFEAATPYLFIKRLLRELRPELLSEPLAGQLEEIDPTLLPWAPLVALALDRPTAPTAEVDALDPSVLPERIAAALASLFLALADGTAAWVVEDAQWVDEASSDVLVRLASRVVEQPVVLCLSGPSATGISGVTRHVVMEVGPLDADEAASLLTAATTTPLLPQQRRAVSSRAKGNPLFLIGLAREGATEDLPDSLESLVGIELDRLPLLARRAVRRLSVVGVRAPKGIADALLGADDGPGSWVSALGDIVEEDADEVAFRHPLYQEVAYASLPFRLRRDLHRQALAAFEASAGAPIGLLSLHAELGRDDDRTWLYAAEAAEMAAAKRAYLETATLARRAVDAARRLGRSDARVLDLHLALGDALRHTGQPDAAAAVYGRARRLSRIDDVGRATISLRLGLVREAAGDLDGAYRRYRSGLKSIAGLTGPDHACSTIRIRLLQGCAQARYLQGKTKVAATLARDALAAAERVEDDEGVAQAYELLHLLSLSAPIPEGAEAGWKALAIYERIGRADWQAAALNNLGMDAYYRGDWIRAVELYQRSWEHEQRCGRTIKAASCAANIAEIWSDQGRLIDARRAFEDALEAFRAGSQKLAELITLSNLGRVAARLGRFDEADAFLDEALEGFTSRGLGASSYAAEIEAKRCEALVLRGHSSAALEAVTSLLDRAPALAPSLHRLRGFALLQFGDHQAALTALDEAASSARAAGSAFDEALALDAIGLADPTRADEAAVASARLADLGVVKVARPPLPAAALIT